MKHYAYVYKYGPDHDHSIKLSIQDSNDALLVLTMSDKRSLPKFPDAFMKKQLDDCDRPACEDIVAGMKAAFSRAEAKKEEERTPSGGIVECPPSSAKLGNASWTLLHSMAAWYPDSPTRDDQTVMVNFFSAIAQFYPCTWCATDFANNLKQKPVQAETREALCVWLCEQHNIVNTKIGKPRFQCDMKTLDERWRKSSNSKCKADH